METLAARATRRRNNDSGSRLIHRALEFIPALPAAVEVARWLNVEAQPLTLPWIAPPYGFVIMAD
jgi:hypothetical protein